MTRAETLELQRVATDMEALDKRTRSIETKQGHLEKRIIKIEKDTEAILKAVVGVSKFGIALKKHGPRVFAFLVGVAVTNGNIPAEFGNAILKTLGFQ